MNLHDRIPTPTARCLRIFAFDPSLAVQSDTAGIAELTVTVPWEEGLEPGPVGEYLEVVDVDPASGMLYPPVRLLSRHGGRRREHPRHARVHLPVA